MTPPRPSPRGPPTPLVLALLALLAATGCRPGSRESFEGPAGTAADEPWPAAADPGRVVFRPNPFWCPRTAAGR